MRTMSKPKSLADWLQEKVDEARGNLQEAEAEYKHYTSNEQRLRHSNSVSRELRNEYNRYVKVTKNNA